MPDLCKHGQNPCEACAFERGQRLERERCLNIVLSEQPPSGPAPDEVRERFAKMSLEDAHALTTKVTKEAIARRIQDPFEGKAPAPGAGKNLVIDSLSRAKALAGGAATAEALRWALNDLARAMADHAAKVYHTHIGANMLRDELLRAAGLWRKP